MIETVFNIIVEAYIIFIIFAIFFYILISNILTNYQITTVSQFAVKQLQLYGLDAIKEIPGFREYVTQMRQDAAEKEAERQTEVDTNNSTYKKNQIIVLVSMTIGTGILLAFPLLMGWVSIRNLPFARYLRILLINLIIIIGIEVFFIKSVIGNYTSIRFYPLLESSIRA